MKAVSKRGKLVIPNLILGTDLIQSDEMKLRGGFLFVLELLFDKEIIYNKSLC